QLPPLSAPCRILRLRSASEGGPYNCCGEFFDCFFGHSTSFGVGSKNVGDAGEFCARGALEDAFDDRRNAEERQTAVEEGGDSDFVGSIQRGRESSALFHGFARKTEAREAPSRSFFKIESLQFGPVQGYLVG